MALPSLYSGGWNIPHPTAASSPCSVVTDEVLLGVEYSTPSTVEQRQPQCLLLNVMYSRFTNLDGRYRIK